MPRISAPSRRGAKDKHRKLHTPSVAVGVSALAHIAAIGALLTLKPVPHLAPTLEIIEISLVPEQALRSPRTNNLSGAIPGASTVDVSAVPHLSWTHPDVTASSVIWSRSVNTGYSFGAPTLPTFRPHTRALIFDTFATMLDCLAVAGSTHGASGRSRRAHPPCASDDPSIHAPMMTLLPMHPSQPGGTSTGIDYRTFPKQSVFYESVFPDEVSPANRALEKWIAGLFY